MIILVTGDRNWKDSDLIAQVLSQYGPGTVLVHGAASGADAAAAAYAYRRQVAGDDWQVIPEPAEWQKYGRAAGPIRNQRMLDNHRIDVCHAFHNYLPSSKGTRDMVTRCQKAGIPVHLHTSTT